MNIFILEDHPFHRSRLENSLQQVIERYQLADLAIDGYSRPEDLLAAVSDKGRRQLYFLDIKVQYAGISGFEVAKQIRQNHPQADIAIVTSCTDFIPKVFEHLLAATDYIDKDLEGPIFEKRIEKLLLKIYSRLKN